MLALVVGTLVLSIALPLRELLAQRAQIRGLQQGQVEARQRVAELQAERARLQDPAYVAAEARRRLHFVKPGETAYVLLQPSAPPKAAGPDGTVPGGTAGAQAPWYSQLWGSVQAADRAARPPAP